MKHLQRSVPRLRQFMIMDYAANYSQNSHRAVCHELLCILDGQVTLHLEKNLQFNAIPGDLLLVPANSLHRDEFTARKGLRVLFITFDWDEPEFFRTVNNLVLINLNYDTRSEVQRRLEFMRMRWENSPGGLLHATFQLHGILLLLYFDAANPSRTPAAENPLMHESMYRAKHFIRRNYASQITLADTAAFVGMNATYFSKQFFHEFGINFSSYLTAIRLETARHLLLNGSKQVAEVSALCGFSSSGYFIKVFRKRFGLTPKAYVEAERCTVLRNL